MRGVLVFLSQIKKLPSNQRVCAQFGALMVLRRRYGESGSAVLKGKGDDAATLIWHYGEIVPVACINVVTWLHRAIDAGCQAFLNGFWVMFESQTMPLVQCPAYKRKRSSKLTHFLPGTLCKSCAAAVWDCVRAIVHMCAAGAWLGCDDFAFVITAFRPHSLTYPISIFSRWSSVA